MVGEYVAFATSVVGASHIKADKPCQDSSLCIQEQGYILTAVADGHGGAEYFRSDIGSSLAVQAASTCMTDSNLLAALATVSVEKEREKIILQLKKSIVAHWYELITIHFANNPFAETELVDIKESTKVLYQKGEQYARVYGTTLLASLLTDTFWLGLQIGDGHCVVVDAEGVYLQPIEQSEKCFLNVTTSLCDKNAIEEFYHLSLQELPAAIFIGTDGIDNGFAGTEKLYDFYRVALGAFQEQDFETAKNELHDYLPRLSEKGSGDDISLGMIIKNFR